MKAAVLEQFGGTPTYQDFPDPIPGADEITVCVKAVALENIDRAMAKGTHYATSQFMPKLPAIIGFDGIGMLDDGRLIGFGGMRPPYGSMAELAVIPKTHQVPIPDGVDAVSAAAIPASALTALFPLKWGAALQPGETVLINGATGFTGKLTVQIAKLLGAGKVIGTGRNDQALQSLQALGVDAVIDLKQDDDALIAAYKRAAEPSGYNVIIDFLWGHPTELLLKALVPDQLSFAKDRIRLIHIGEMAGPTISLSGDMLRTSGLEIVGGSKGLTPEAIGEGTAMVWDYLKTGKIKADIEQVALEDIAQAWQRTDLHGKRIVIIP